MTVRFPATSLLGPRHRGLRMAGNRYDRGRFTSAFFGSLPPTTAPPCPLPSSPVSPTGPAPPCLPGRLRSHSPALPPRTSSREAQTRRSRATRRIWRASQGTTKDPKVQASFPRREGRSGPLSELKPGNEGRTPRFRARSCGPAGSVQANCMSGFLVLSGTFLHS